MSDGPVATSQCTSLDLLTSVGSETSFSQEENLLEHVAEKNALSLTESKEPGPAGAETGAAPHCLLHFLPPVPCPCPVLLWSVEQVVWLEQPGPAVSTAGLLLRGNHVDKFAHLLKFTRNS